MTRPGSLVRRERFGVRVVVMAGLCVGYFLSDTHALHIAMATNLLWLWEL